MSQFKYTFIIPHKNSPELLQRCIDSIPERENVQIIIVDDNSSKEIVNRQKFPGLGRKHTEVYFTEDGKGAGYARNVGLAHAKGQWLLFADADDYYAPGFLDVLDKELEDNREILFFNVFSNVEGINNRAKTINEDYETFIKTKDINIIKYKNWPPWNKVFSKKFIDDNKLSFEEIPVGNDAMFSLNASLLSKNISVINDQLYCITNQPQSITFTRMNYERRMAYLRINIRINKFLKKINLSKYQLLITTPDAIQQIYKEKGFKTVLNYLIYIHKEYSIAESIYLWIQTKFKILQIKLHHLFS